MPASVNSPESEVTTRESVVFNRSEIEVRDRYRKIWPKYDHNMDCSAWLKCSVQRSEILDSAERRASTLFLKLYLWFKRPDASGRVHVRYHTTMSDFRMRPGRAGNPCHRKRSKVSEIVQ
jgi:hypothetical protein